jgi:hypothetical protein
VSSSDSAAVDSGAVDPCDSVVLACAPPLLPMVTPDDTWVLEDVVPDVFVVSVGVVAAPADVDPLAADAVDDSPVDVDSAELDEGDDSEDVSVVSAAATP